MKKNIFKTLLCTAVVFVLITGGVGFCYDDDYVDEAEEAMYKAQTAYKQGIALTRSKSYEKALEAFNTALKYNPEMSDAYYNIASIYIARGNDEDAFKNYMKAIEINPYDYDSVIQIAKMAYNKKNYSLAMRYARMVPEDSYEYAFASQLYNDASELLNQSRNKIERAKITTANENKKVLIDKFESPAGIAVDSSGNMYVACYAENSVIKYDKNKKKTVFAKDFLLDGPVGIAIDAFDNLYVANFDADNILKITKGGQVSIFMDRVSKPYFLYIKNDILYISEQGNDVVVTYNLNIK